MTTPAPVTQDPTGGATATVTPVMGAAPNTALVAGPATAAVAAHVDIDLTISDNEENNDVSPPITPPPSVRLPQNSPSYFHIVSDPWLGLPQDFEF